MSAGLGFGADDVALCRGLLHLQTAESFPILGHITGPFLPLHANKGDTENRGKSTENRGHPTENRGNLARWLRLRVEEASLYYFLSVIFFNLLEYS